MMRLPRLLTTAERRGLLFHRPMFGVVPLLAILAWAAPVALLPIQSWAQDQVQVPAQLRTSVENFWHFGKIARYDLANNAAREILAAGADPLAVLVAFEQTAESRNDNLDQWLLRWQGIEAMKDVTTQIMETLAEGYQARREDPAFIEGNIQRLSAGERAYGIAFNRLRESGELAVPFMVKYLQDPAQSEHHPSIRRALRDLGRIALNPLVAATEMDDHTTLATIVTVLGDLGYDLAVPYLVRVVQSKSIPMVTRNAAFSAAQRLRMADPQNANVAELFYQLGEKFYYEQAAVVADPRRPVAYVWYWQNGTLIKRDVPAAIFNEIMAMRSAEYALELGGAEGDPLSLWLAANYKREAELPEGQVDPTRAPNQPAPHYYGVAAGPQYLNRALARALRDRNPAVALAVIRSLQDVVGRSNLFSGTEGRPLIDAMAYPNRQVRFAAAFAVAGARPTSDFPGQERVVPLLAEALGQTGVSGVLVAIPDRDRLTQVIGQLQNLGFSTAGEVTPESAARASQQLPAVDAILIADTFGEAGVAQMLAIAAERSHLQGAARIVLVQTPASIWVERAASDPLLSTTQASEGDDLRQAIEQGLAAAGAAGIDAEVATALAIRAGELLRDIAISGATPFDLSVAHTPLLRTLTEDQRPQIVMLAGQVLSQLDGQDIQFGLLQKGLSDEVDPEVRVSVLKSLAANAGLFGNRLGTDQVTALQTLVREAPSNDIKIAAAEAHGAMNLPADQARMLIVEQARR